MSTTPDRIEKRVLLRAPRTRVWQAIADAEQFGSWFGVRFDAPFTPGGKMTGRIVPTTADPEVAKTQEPYAGTKFNLTVETIEPEGLFVFRWHPFAVDPHVDYTKEPMTRVSFALEATVEGTLLTLTETGFDQLPAARWTEAFKMNEGGWTAQMTLVEKYLSRAR